MPPKKRKIKKNKGKSHHIILVLLLVIAGTFIFFEEFGKEDIPRGFFDVFMPEEEPAVVSPAVPLSRKLPKVAIVMDDLGNNRSSAVEVMKIKEPLSFSILPMQKFSVWIAEEGHRLGRDIMLHVPMEATRLLKLGEGGLYTWMTGGEIISALNEDLETVPHIKGVSNHMGSAFTQDEQSMEAFFAGMKGRGLFFLDSLTAPGSVGFKFAKQRGIKALRRDIFLDNTDDPAAIDAQWKKLVRIARKRGYAIALAHPRKNTLMFLQDVLENNGEVEVVPVSELLDE